MPAERATFPSKATDAGAVVADARWLADRYDPGHDAFHFRWVTRDEHRAAMFLTNEYLAASAPVVVGRGDAIAAAPPPAPLRFIFHSAFCCSTLLARAVDAPGVAMGLKEPVVLNDLIGWKARGATPAELTAVLGDALALLARPFAPGEAVVVKPSNIVNGLASAMLALRPESRALLLVAPLRTFLGSITRKGMWGRVWVRDLLVKQIEDGTQWPGMTTPEFLCLTDLQAAAIGWLAQHAIFARIAARFPDRVRTLDSETLMAGPGVALTALAALFALDLDGPAIAAGPVFAAHAKFGGAFDGAARTAAREAEGPFADEIDKVTIWAEAVAAGVGLGLTLPGALLQHS